MENIETPIQKACRLVGSQATLAGHLGISPQAVNQWCSFSRQIPPEHCPKIERLTGGQVRCEELNGKVDWAYLRAAAGACDE